MTIRSTDSQSALDKANKRRTTLTFIGVGASFILHILI